VVLWFHYEGNDLRDLKQERSYPLLMGYLKGGFHQNLFGRQAEIAHVLATYVEAEMGRSELSRRLEALFKGVRDSTRLLETAKEITKLVQLRQRLGLIYGSNGSDQVLPGDLTPDIKDLFAQILLEAKRSVSLWGGEVYFVYLPEWRTNWEIIREDKEELMSVVRSLGIPIMDVHRVLQLHGDPASLFPLRMVGHYNEEGHRLVAEEVLRSISLEN
jgi:hypothetical protein